MTRESARAADGGQGSHTGDTDLLAGLWEEALFARLPWDAPTELRDLVEDIENPRRVYAIHRASRRHDFQVLLQKFVVQLRDGCGASYCTTATCFTCRKRLAGKAPIRRYNTTSARTLAAYLASQDNPEGALCPNLRTPKAPPAAVDSLVFSPRRTTAAFAEPDLRSSKSQNGHNRPLSPKGKPSSHAAKSPQTRPRGASLEGAPGQRETTHPASRLPGDERTGRLSPAFDVSEKPVSTDYRSFAANLFGTVAFKMVEWLSASGLQEMSRRAGTTQEEVEGNGTRPPQPAAVNGDGSRPSSPLFKDAEEVSEAREPVKTPSPTPEHAPLTATDPSHESSLENGTRSTGVPELQSAPSVDPQRVRRPSLSKSSSLRSSTNTKVRTSSSSKAKRQVSVDAVQADSSPDEAVSGLRPSRRASVQPEKPPKALKASNTRIPRPISQLSTSGFFDQVALEKMPPPKAVEVRAWSSADQVDGVSDEQDDGANGTVPNKRSTSPMADQPLDHRSNGPRAPALDPAYEKHLPQALSRLDADVVDFICDVLQEDGTAELHVLEPPTITRFHGRALIQGKALRRRPLSRRREYPSHLALEWRLFAEQSLFYIFSDPEHLIESFTQTGQLYDSQTLWYCMLRMTRVAPSIVFHSLWLAAAALFAPPRSLQALRSPTARLFPKHEQSLSNEEAGYLMSICLHALIAAAPLVHSAQQLYDVSRLRSHGLALAGSGAIARPPTELCLQYDDAFGNDLTMRLARRVFAAITTRRLFDDMDDMHSPGDGDRATADVLAPLFAQLDFLNMDAVYILNFSLPDRTLHETRVPTLLLDWARAVMLNDWDGRPEVSGDGPFGGALALIASMHKKRQDLLLGDAEFRCDYFAERLDPVSMPVSWLASTSTRQKLHLLDFPYMFSPSTLVSYFRSINFSRMSRSFEESSSLSSRMSEGRPSTIISPASLVAGAQYQSLLSDLLQTGSAKYLILEIGRDDVLLNAFDQLWRREERELLRPLKVHLGESKGEEGFDSGGVQQEFFRLAIAEALDPDYGAFTVDDRTRMVWFNPGSLEPDWKYELVGLLVSLALYNGLTLPITFPKALYRKLLGEPVTELHHIADGWPDLASGLTTLLEWDEKDGLVEDVFARTYEFSISVFGQPISRIMKSSSAADEEVLAAPVKSPAAATTHNGYRDSTNSYDGGGGEEEDWPQFPKTASLSNLVAALHEANPPDAPLVTHANRSAYVTDYIRYLTHTSVAPQYAAFARGFRACLHAKSLALLAPPLLQSLVEGVQDIDVAELQRHARYVGWDAAHRTVRHFWDVVRRFDDAMKRRLLEFVTASDRVPVGGIKNLQFVVQRNGEEDEHGHLPTAYTCYGTLLLPEYKTKEILRERLSMALENAQGFGFA